MDKRILARIKRPEDKQRLEMQTCELNFLIFDVVQAVKKNEKVSMVMEDDNTMLIYACKEQ